MRISTSVYLNTALAGMQDQQSNIARLSAQLAADKRVLQPKDDPLAAGRALELSANIARRGQYAVNQQTAQVTLAHEQTVLDGLHDALDRVRGILIGGVSAANDLPLRQRYATEMQGLYQTVKDMANTRDSAGRFIFAGNRTTIASQQAPNTQAPFEHVQTGTAPANASTYGGDASTREVLLDASARLKVSDDLNSTVLRAGAGLNLDLLQTLDQIIIDLNDPNLTQATLNARLTAMQTTLENLQLIEADLAARQVRLADLTANNAALLNLDKDALGKLQELDQAAAITELRQREIALQAAQQAYARTTELSLFNFL